jgi:hypothetical protein
MYYCDVIAAAGCIVLYEVRTKNYTTPDDESIDSKHVEKCEECKHLGTRKNKLCVLKVKVNRI